MMVRRNWNWLRVLPAAAGLTVVLGLTGPAARAEEPAREKSQNESSPAQLDREEEKTSDSERPSLWGSAVRYVAARTMVMLLPLPPSKPNPKPKPKPTKPKPQTTPGGISPTTTPPTPTTPTEPPENPELPDVPVPLDTPQLPPVPPAPPTPPESPPTTTEQTPEPATMVLGLVGLGVAGAALLRRRLKKS
jgi:MYXO-CTERM domain-containing protein